MTSLQDTASFFTQEHKAPCTDQGRASKTFKAPPLDTSLTLPELYEFHAKNSPEHPLFLYTEADGQSQYLNYSNVYRAIRKAATYVCLHSNLSPETQQALPDEERPVAGVLAISGEPECISPLACA